MIYNEIPTCRALDNLDVGMNDITSQVVESFANVTTPNRLGVLRISSQKFSFFEINDRVCRKLIQLLNTNPRLGDVNFNMGPVEWHHSYRENGRMKWHHFFPSYLTYGLHFNNKRVNYLKTKELTERGRRDLERVQYLLDYNWTGRSLVSHIVKNDTPASLWPLVLERVWKGRTCFWTGREQGSKLEYGHSVTYGFLREHLVAIFNSAHHNRATKCTKRRHDVLDTTNGIGEKKLKMG